MNCLTPSVPQFTVQGYAIRPPGGKTVQGLQSLAAWRNAHAEAPDYWLRLLICTAFSHMFARRMQDTPAADLIDTVAEGWIFDIGEGMTEELDRERIVAGFKLIFRECSRWPQPKDLLKRLARRPSAPLRDRAVNVDAVDEGAHERSAEAIDAILESLG